MEPSSVTFCSRPMVNIRHRPNRFVLNGTNSIDLRLMGMDWGVIAIIAILAATTFMALARGHIGR
jgi:hypothetical protein